MNTVKKALIIPISSQKKILIQDRRGHRPPDWGFFGGGVESDETVLNAVLRETKEELDLDLVQSDLVYIGNNDTTFNSLRVQRSFFLYRTNQEDFTVLEGAGAHWFTFDQAREKLDIAERFDSILEMINNNK